MDTINPWLDPTEVRKLAEKLIRPVEHSPVISKDPGFDTSFVGFVDINEPSKPVTPVTPTASPPTPASPSNISAPKPPAPLSKLKPLVKIPVKPRVTTLLDSRFLNLRNWLSEKLAAREMFILDQSGSVIFDESHHGRMHFAARDLILQSSSMQHIRVKMDPSTNLELIPCETRKGLVILGALFNQPISGDHITSIRNAISQSLSA